MHNCDSLRHQMVCAIYTHFHSVLLHVMAVASPLSRGVAYKTALVDSKTRDPNGQEHGLVGGGGEATGLPCSQRRQASTQLRVRHATSCSRSPGGGGGEEAGRKHSRAQRRPEGASAGEGEHPERRSGRRSTSWSLKALLGFSTFNANVSQVSFPCTHETKPH